MNNLEQTESFDRHLIKYYQDKQLTSLQLERLQSLTEEVVKLRSFYFQKGEMKSSSVKNDRQRRAKILSAFAKLDFKFYALCVDKERIHEDSGLRYKKTFFKYLNMALMP